MFIDEIRASLRDWDRKWHSAPGHDYMRRFAAMTPAQQEEARVRLARMREDASALQLLFQEVK